MDKKEELDLIMKEIHRQAMMSCIQFSINNSNT